ncbi:MAG: hypothetical protein KGL74_13510 [Elusimicrobia bacterium]|nr:hypothetical protein [Elusimicrobiota bacterium]MDE2512136.1 hypothetical protein [Elusimicrobiota bacterium]
MLKKVALPLAAAALLSLLAAAPRPAPRDSFLPPNNLKHKMGAAEAGGITEAQFNAVMDRMQALYGPVIAEHGATLVINRLWTDDTVNASAEQNGSTWVLNMYGGLARDKAITQDGMALVACHEMGHHLGGAPRYGGTDWAANEGEADYFANSKCLHRFFGDAATANFTHPKVLSDDAALAKKACAQSYSGAKDRAICERSAAAGQSVTALFTELSGDAPAHFDTPDASVVAQTNDEHPASQCRLDTYFQASLCNKDYHIPMSNTDPAAGACVLSQGYKVGMRPFCWYKPAAGELIGRDAAVAAAMEKKAGAVSSQTLAALKGSDVFAGL